MPVKQSSFTHQSLLLVLIERGILVQANFDTKAPAGHTKQIAVEPTS
jgi:hypothetical protein